MPEDTDKELNQLRHSLALAEGRLSGQDVEIQGLRMRLEAAEAALRAKTEQA